MGCCSHSIHRRQFTVSCYHQNGLYSLSDAPLLFTKKGCVYNKFQSKLSVYPDQNGINFSQIYDTPPFPFPLLQSHAQAKGDPSALASIHRFPLLSGDLVSAGEGGEA
jgi:hypothetical protein